MESLSRRGFLKRSLLATSGSMLVPQFLKAFETPDRFHHLATNSDDRILIVLQLSGGNDGLNTIIPFRNDLYYQLRPTLGIKKENLLTISDELGFNPALASLREIYDQGFLSIVN